MRKQHTHHTRTPAAPAEQTQDVVIVSDLVVAVLDQCGLLLPSHIPSPHPDAQDDTMNGTTTAIAAVHTRLVRTLEALWLHVSSYEEKTKSATLRQQQQQQQQQHRLDEKEQHENDESSSSVSFLLALEAILTNLRSTCRTLNQVLDREVSDAVSLFIELETTTESPAANLTRVPTIGVLRSLLVTWQHHLRIERQLLRDMVQWLDEFYATTTVWTGGGGGGGGGGERTNFDQRLPILLDSVSQWFDPGRRDEALLSTMTPHLREAVRILRRQTVLSVLHEKEEEEGDPVVPEHPWWMQPLESFSSSPFRRHRSEDRHQEADTATAVVHDRWNRKQAMISASTIEQVISLFVTTPSLSTCCPLTGKHPCQHATPAVLTTSFLIMGDAGCGKTHVCNTAQTMAQRQGIPVLRPHLPLDVLGSVVGQAEDTVVALFGAAMAAAAAHADGCAKDATERNGNRVLILLDGLEHIVASSKSNNEGGGTRLPRENHVKRRTQSALLAMMDAISRHANNHERCLSEILLIGTITKDDDPSLSSLLSSRFDRVFIVQPPNAEQRRKMILDMMMTMDDDNDDGVNTCGNSFTETYNETKDWSMQELLPDIVESTVGQSCAEIAQLVRQATADAISAWGTPEFAGKALTMMKSRLLSSTPASLRSGVLDDFVDMRVWNAHELGVLSSAVATTTSYELPLKGVSAAKAWTELETSIVIPLCRSRELMDLLDARGNSHPKRVTSGILLTGPSGSGKSEIAFHCARYAASLLPSIKLIDVSCTSLVHKEVGGSEQAIHHLFDSARRAAPCIILMDGIENVAAVRGNDTTTEGTMDRVLSTLLVELDGVDDVSRDPTESGSGGIAVIGITHNPAWIDPALKRPGRLERIIHLELDWPPHR